jgi:hypothetical protein
VWIGEHRYNTDIAGRLAADYFATAARVLQKTPMAGVCGRRAAPGFNARV